MDEPQFNKNRPANPRRKKRTQVQIIKEAYLPVIIAGVALLMILIFIIGSISRGVQRKEYEQQAKLEASIAAQEKQDALKKEVKDILAKASAAAQSFDYDTAIALLDGFSGDSSQFPELAQKRAEYDQAIDALVLWDNPTKVLNLSFQMLIADPGRAFPDNKYGSSYNKNFVTTEEFSKIIQQLYENNYILIDMDDITDGVLPKSLYLPEGKKPLILTQTQVNYNTYMIDSDGDKLPDKGGDGFASRLMVDENGTLTCEMVTADGQTVTGNYDLVPILESFIATHPDFSYKGARAILAVTGYDGLFGYRTNPAAKDSFGADNYEKQVEDAKNLIKVLRDTGYDIACYTYNNLPYGTKSLAQIQEDLNKWNTEVSPVLGIVDTLVYARNSDIGDHSMPYSGEKYTMLRNFGFVYYLGFSTDGTSWFTSEDDCIRQDRILVTGENMKLHADWFSGIFDVASVIDSTRPAIS